ncbi:MAG: DUF1552 domain-containing protein [Deltaproteobacteria bacterium]|nr:MAG: DUF1552 domain-containing protein [Deltaproteobacteria bacterium]
MPETYECTGGMTDFTLSPILEPFADLRDHMVLVGGLTVPKASNTPGEDHGNCMVTFMTGGVPYKPEGTGIAVAERISIDQVFANDPAFSGGVPIHSLQLAADDRGQQFFVRILSYAGRGEPLPPEQDPMAAYARVFGTFFDGVTSPADAARLRANKQSVLDFARGDLGRLRGQLGGEGRERLDRHLAATAPHRARRHRRRPARRPARPDRPRPPRHHPRRLPDRPHPRRRVPVGQHGGQLQPHHPRPHRHRLPHPQPLHRRAALRRRAHHDPPLVQHDPRRLPPHAARHPRRRRPLAARQHPGRVVERDPPRQPHLRQPPDPAVRRRRRPARRRPARLLRRPHHQ